MIQLALVDLEALLAVRTTFGDSMRYRRGRFSILEIVSNAYNKEGLTTPPVENEVVETVDEVKPGENDGIEKKKVGRPKKE